MPPRIGVGEGLDAHLPTGFARQIDRTHVVLQPVAHVAVLGRDGALDGGARLGGRHRAAATWQHQLAVGLQPVQLEVAQDEVQLGLGRAAAHLVDVDEAVAAVGRLGRAPGLRQRVDDLGGQMDGIDQLVLGRAGVDGDAADLDLALSAEKVS